MRKTLLAMMAMAVAVFAQPALAETVEIASATDWATFAGRVNGGETALDAVMTADVTLTQDSPRIGTEDCRFAGSFDGAGHTLTMSWNLADTFYLAPFSYVAGCTIRNLHTTGSVTSSAEYASGLIGWINGRATIEKCRCSATVTSTVDGESRSGGFFGRTYWSWRFTVTIRDCLFDGSLLGPSATHCSGFGDNAFQDPTVVISNSLFAPREVTVSSSNAGTFTKSYMATHTQVSNSYYTQTLGDAQGTDASSMTAAALAAALGGNWTVSEGKPMLKLFAVPFNFTFASEGATIGRGDYMEGDAQTAPVPTRSGDYIFLGYFTEDGSQVFDASGALVAGSLSGLSADTTLYARWAPPEGSVVKLVYRGQLNLLTGEAAVNDEKYVKRMHFRVYDDAEAPTPLWSIDDQDVTVNADGSFVHAFGDDALAALIATGKVTHVGLAIGPSASLATELKPRRALRPVATVNRALTAEGAALDVRVGSLATENALVAADATVSHLEVAGRVTAPGAGKVEVSPLVVGPDERTRLMRGNGVKVFSREKPAVLVTVTSALRGQVLATAPADGIALISSNASGSRALRCPAVVQYCRKGESVRAPTSDAGGLKVTFFPFVGNDR